MKHVHVQQMHKIMESNNKCKTIMFLQKMKERDIDIN